MKIATASLIFKGGNNLQAENYRPISGLLVFWKNLEKIIYNWVYNYFVETTFFSLNNLAFKLTLQAKYNLRVSR